MDDARFWAKVDRRGPNECWPWLGAHKAHGYGHLNRRNRWVLAHRWAYELVIGPVPDGLELDHLCVNPRCVNPAHLEPVTPTENVRRATERRTHCKNGHPYTPENTYLWKGTRRYCRACHAEDARRQRRRARERREDRKHGQPQWTKGEEAS